MITLWRESDWWERVVAIFFIAIAIVMLTFIPSLLKPKSLTQACQLWEGYYVQTQACIDYRIDQCMITERYTLDQCVLLIGGGK